MMATAQEPGQGYEPGNNTIQRPSIKAMLDELTTMPWCPVSKIVTDLERVRIVAICNMLGFQVTDPWTHDNKWDWPTYIDLICKAWAYLGQVEFHQPPTLTDDQMEYNRLQNMMTEQDGQTLPKLPDGDTTQVPSGPALPRKTNKKPLKKMIPKPTGWQREPVTGVTLKQIRETVGPARVSWVLAIIEKSRMDTIKEQQASMKLKKIRKIKKVV